MPTLATSRRYTTCLPNKSGVKVARVRAEDWVDARIRRGIPLARFTEEEHAEWDAKEALLYVGSGISDTRDFHVDVDFIY